MPWLLGALYHIKEGKTKCFAKGEFADVRLYARALSDEEVRVVHAQASARRKK
jgi:hypothetical protein